MNQKTPKVSRRKEIMKIRAEINEKEKGGHQQQTKVYVESISKTIWKPLDMIIDEWDKK